MADEQAGTGTGAEVEGIGVWETIALVIMLAVLAAAIGTFVYGLVEYGTSH